MNTRGTAVPFWSTASLGDMPHSTPKERLTLAEHLKMCIGSRGRMFTLHCLAETLNGFMLSRFVTTVAMVALLIGASSLIA